MPFFGSKPALAPQPPAAPAPPAPPAAGPTPPAPPAAPVAQRNFWCLINGASVLTNEAAARTLAPTTQAMTEDQKSGWQPIGALLGAAPAAPAAQAGTRAAFQRPATSAAPAAFALNDPFAGVENGQVTRRGTYLEPGKYIAKLASAEFKKGRQKNMVILEVKILTSSYNAEDPSTHGANREGSNATVFVLQNDSFIHNMKEIMLALSGFDETNKPRPETDVVSKDECNALVSPEQPYSGATVYLETLSKPKRDGTGEFTLTNWWPCPLMPDGSPDQARLFSEIR